MKSKRLATLVLTLGLASVLASAGSPAVAARPPVTGHGPMERSFAAGDGLTRTIGLLMASDVAADVAQQVADAFFQDRFGGETFLTT